MSGQNSWISIGVGVIVGIATWYVGGTPGWAIMAGGVAMAATGLILGPDQLGGSSEPKPDQLEIAQSKEDTTIPVVFGTTRVPGNYIYVGYDKFKSVPIKKKGEGKGAEDSIVGYTYKFPMSLGICMGPIDRIIRVKASPGQKKMTDLPDGGLAMGSTKETFDIKITKKQGDITTVEGGSCDFYPGSTTQGSGLTELDDNHRGVCWADFPKYRIDGTTTPRTLLFEVRRMPVVQNDAGDDIRDFPKRAAVDTTFPEYDDANPAAVAYEILKNETWGKGLEVARIDVDSFRAAAKYYQAKRLGISTALTRTTLSSFMQRLRELFGLWIWWDGDRMRAKVIYDNAEAYAQRRTITAEDVIGAPQFGRQSPNSAFNEVRLTFTNRQNNWQSEVATSRDLAHAQTIGGIRSQTIDGNEIGTRRAAEQISALLLRQIAYPPATCTLKLRRTFSGLQPTSFIALVWDEWREEGVATTYWRVVDVEDDDQTAEGVSVTMIEDLYRTHRDGMLSHGEWVTPDGIDDEDALTNDDIALDDLANEPAIGSILPVALWEPNIFLSGATARIAMLPCREYSSVQAMDLAWALNGSSATSALPTSSLFPIRGTIESDIPADGPRLVRALTAPIHLSLTNSSAAEFEAATGLVQTDSDDFSELLRTREALLLIGNELLQVGFAEATSGMEVDVLTYVRGVLGTPIEEHFNGEPFYFIPVLDEAALIDSARIPRNQPVDIYCLPHSSGVANATAVRTPLAPGPSYPGWNIVGKSLCPFPPEARIVWSEYVLETTTWIIKIRPRLWHHGIETQPSIEDDLNDLVTGLYGLKLKLQRSDDDEAIILDADRSFNTPPFTFPDNLPISNLLWRPDNGTAASGYIEIVMSFHDPITPPASLKIWTVLGSNTSESFVEVSPP